MSRLIKGARYDRDADHPTNDQVDAAFETMFVAIKHRKEVKALSLRIQRLKEALEKTHHAFETARAHNKFGWFEDAAITEARAALSEENKKDLGEKRGVRTKPLTGKNYLIMKKPNANEIATELAVLKDMAPRIRQRDAFGGDNRASIDAQIRVIEKDMSESSIYDKGEWDDAKDCDVVSSAIEARQWLDGEAEDGAPSKAWNGLLSK